MGKYGVVGKYTVKLAQALRAHLVQHGGIFGVIAAEMDIEMLCCGALQRVQGLCAVGVAHVFQQIQIGKFLPIISLYFVILISFLTSLRILS